MAKPFTDGWIEGDASTGALWLLCVITASAMAWPTLSGAFTHPDEGGLSLDGRRTIQLVRLPQRLTKVHKMLNKHLRKQVVDTIFFDGQAVDTYQAWQRVVLKFWSSAGARELIRVDEHAAKFRVHLGMDGGELDATMVYTVCHGLWEFATRNELHGRVRSLQLQLLQVRSRIFTPVANSVLQVKDFVPQLVSLMTNRELSFAHNIVAAVLAALAINPDLVPHFRDHDVLSAVLAARRAASAVAREARKLEGPKGPTSKVLVNVRDTKAAIPQTTEAAVAEEAVKIVAADRARREQEKEERLLNEDEITSRDPRLDMHAAMMLDRMTSHAPGCELLASHPASADLLYYLIRGGMPPARRYEPCGVCCQSTCSGDPVCRM